MCTVKLLMCANMLLQPEILKNDCINGNLKNPKSHHTSASSLLVILLWGKIFSTLIYKVSVIVSLIYKERDIMWADPLQEKCQRI